jgi:3-deoxy-D-manno-octulosonic-acid transferase
VLQHPSSVPRLRAILQRPELIAADGARDAARLRSLGVSEVISFSVVEASSGTMVKFSFAPASRRAL